MDGLPEKSNGLELVNGNEGLPLPPVHIEAMPDGSPAASASVAAMHPSLRDPPVPSGFVAALLDVAFDDDASAKRGDGGLKTTGLGKM